MFTWDETMTTGIDSVDSQHKWLINRINDLLVAIEIKDNRHGVEEVLQSLDFYARWHFNFEEDCMEEYACPAAAQNKEEHQLFIKHFTELGEQYIAGTLDEEVINAIIKDLGDWLVKHIINVDSHLNHCVLAHQVKKNKELQTSD